jgi:hypothetical protein
LLLTVHIILRNKEYIMNKKATIASSGHADSQALSIAVEHFVACGGVINVLSDTESALVAMEPPAPYAEPDAQAEQQAKIEQLKGLVAKGAGVSALQYTLRMNRKEIKRLASENGLHIRYSRPVRGVRPSKEKVPCCIDDVVAGHAMHYSTLGYTASEIAQMLDLSVKEVWNIGKAYRFEFRQQRQPDLPTQSDT